LLHRSNFVHYFFSLCFSVKKAFQKQKLYFCFICELAWNQP
jgi:hypothetical protein